MLLIAVQAVLIVVAEANDTLLALPELPHYFSVFVWCATFGGFALLVVYFLMSIGAFRGVGEDRATAGLIVAALVGKDETLRKKAEAILKMRVIIMVAGEITHTG